MRGASGMVVVEFVQGLRYRGKDIRSCRVTKCIDGWRVENKFVGGICVDEYTLGFRGEKADEVLDVCIGGVWLRWDGCEKGGSIELRVYDTSLLFGGIGYEEYRYTFGGVKVCTSEELGGEYIKGESRYVEGVRVVKFKSEEGVRKYYGQLVGRIEVRVVDIRGLSLELKTGTEVRGFRSPVVRLDKCQDKLLSGVSGVYFEYGDGRFYKLGSGGKREYKEYIGVADVQVIQKMISEGKI